MRKIWGITFGGLQHKIIVLVLTVLLITIAMFIGVFLYQHSMLIEIVSDTRTEQQQSITRISGETMHATVDSALVSNTVLQAELANNDFAEVIDYLHMMQIMAQGILESRDSLLPVTVNPPDPALDGTPNAHVLFEEGVDYTQSELLGYIGHLSTPLLSILTSSPKVASCYIGLSDGTHLSLDTHTANRFDENGVQLAYPVRERPWYKGAVETGGLYLTGIEKDAFSDDIGITCSIPVYVDGEILAVCGIDVFLNNMKGFVYTANEDLSFSFIINSDCQVILAPEENRLFSVQTADQAIDLRTLGNEALAVFLEEALAGVTPLTEIALRGREYYVVGAPMEAASWAYIAVVDKELTEQSATEMLTEMDKINLEAAARFNQRRTRIMHFVFACVGAILLIGVILAFFSAGRVVKPVEQMTRNIVESGQTGKLFEMKDVYKTNDEIEVLAEAFDDLSKKTRQYIQDITDITREKERISTELDLARKIQEDMLPYIYPAFPDRPEFDIYATMNPAKEVGGDFYDFFLIDRDHLGMVMADVSGKGVPAALFMMMAKILINNYAMLGGSPAKVLEQTNEAICEKNEHEMFVTAWVGILEISTGKITAANAGHEYPILRKASGAFELIKDPHGFVIGGMKGMHYRNYEMTLEKGGMLFLYTDGAPEATNAQEELFGVPRLLDTLNACNSERPVPLLHSVEESISAFVGSADQFDDLTMLAVTLL